MGSAIFKAYDIRGIYPDQIDEEGAWEIGSGDGAVSAFTAHRL